jgi:membrane protease YdiL (CAAX protease family)
MEWSHVLAIGLLAFTLPRRLTQLLAPTDRVSEFLDGALYFQVLGYVLAVFVAIHLVRRDHRGDWGSLGLSWSPTAPRELLAGAGLGAALFATLILVMVKLFGVFEIDQFVRVLVGSTNGLGLALAAIVVVIGAPIIEETFFRGVLYEKLAKRSIWLAIGVTSVWFTIAHGSLLLPIILLMGIVLGWQRRTKSLWYTIGAHAAWNAAVLCIAIFVTSGGWTFTPVDASYSLPLPRGWDRIAAPPSHLPHTTFDIAVESETGSILTITRIPTEDQSSTATLEKVVARLDRTAMSGIPHSSIIPHDHLFDEGAESLQVSYWILEDEAQIGYHLNTMLRPGDSQMIMFTLVCERHSCVDDGGHLDEALHEMDYTT